MRAGSFLMENGEPYLPNPILAETADSACTSHHSQRFTYLASAGEAPRGIIRRCLASRHGGRGSRRRTDLGSEFSFELLGYRSGSTLSELCVFLTVLFDARLRSSRRRECLLWEARRKGDRTSGIRKTQSATAPWGRTTASGLCATIRRQRPNFIDGRAGAPRQPLHICTRSRVNRERVRYAPGPATDLRRRHPQVFLLRFA